MGEVDREEAAPSLPAMVGKYALPCLLLLGGALQDALSAEATADEYKERLARYDLDAKPADHKKLASWCKRNYPAKYGYHQRAYNLHLFADIEAELGADPSIRELKEVHEKAAKMELPGKAREYLGKWGEKQFAEHAKRLKPGDVKMMKQLLTWSEGQKIGFIEPAQELARKILEEEPTYMSARKVLGHIQWKGEWKSLDDAIKEAGIWSVSERIELHKAAAAARAAEERTYPSNPFSGMESDGNIHLFSPVKRPDAKFYVFANDYSRRKPCRLILSLHGGGSGGFEKAQHYARIGIGGWTNQKGSHVVLAPIATKHVTNSWGTLSNVLEILYAMEELSERFNIDRKRIYITGQSMGGGGTTLWYMCFPEFAAASCGRAGWFHHDKKQKDLLGKPIMIIQGEKDEKFRVDSKDSFLKTAAACNGKVTNISYPDVDHFIPNSMTFPKFLPFFEQHVNEIEPDFKVIRAAARKWMK